MQWVAGSGVSMAAAVSTRHACGAAASPLWHAPGTKSVCMRWKSPLTSPAGKKTRRMPEVRGNGMGGGSVRRARGLPPAPGRPTLQSHPRTVVGHGYDTAGIEQDIGGVEGCDHLLRRVQGSKWLGPAAQRMERAGQQRRQDDRRQGHPPVNGGGVGACVGQSGQGR